MGAGAAKIPLPFSLTKTSDNVKSKMWEGFREYMIERIFGEIHG